MTYTYWETLTWAKVLEVAAAAEIGLGSTVQCLLVCYHSQKKIYEQLIFYSIHYQLLQILKNDFAGLGFVPLSFHSMSIGYMGILFIVCIYSSKYCNERQHHLASEKNNILVNDLVWVYKIRNLKNITRGPSICKV